jgi:FkbM family methyltransferase
LELAVISFVNRRIKRFGYQLVDLDEFRQLRRLRAHSKNQAHDLALLAHPQTKNLSRIVEVLPLSKAQLRQDIFALDSVDFKTGGFFVEFGATDGAGLSNTWLLEKHFQWSGIVAEPGKNWHNSLQANRSCTIDTRCVWSETGKEIEFLESSRPELSGASEWKGQLSLRNRETIARTYAVPTVSLLDLLREHQAPKTIDYLSVDTEGSEWEILEAFDFSEYSFRAITVEHNFSENREKFHELLTASGYSRTHESISGWDDWYTKDAPTEL